MLSFFFKRTPSGLYECYDENNELVEGDQSGRYYQATDIDELIVDDFTEETKE